MSLASGSSANRSRDPLRGLRRFVRRYRSGFARGLASGPLRYEPVSRQVLEARYRYSEAASRPDTFVLYRIIGNDLPPRHASGQSRTNLRFLLEHEPVLPDCEKRWIVNRISDADEEARIIALLEQHGQPYLRLPFEPAAYRRIGWDAAGSPFPDLPFSRRLEDESEDVQDRFAAHLRRFKNLYAINNNGARNAALADGRARAKWVLPFDGNCFFTLEAFAALRAAVVADPVYPYLVVPMARVPDNGLLLGPGYAPQPDDEPQLAFRCDATETFDARVPYGRRPKVELFWRLGVPGGWDEYRFDDWDFPRSPLAAERGGFKVAGWVARLASGRADLEGGKGSFVNRGAERNRAVIAMLDRLDEAALAEVLDPVALSFYDDAALRDLQAADPSLAAELKADAERWLGQGPWSVTDKTTLPPSGNRHDYWHPAPYWWPDPRKPDGLPYVKRDGQRVPGTLLHGAGSEQYDRSALQLMLDATVTLALAAAAWGEPAYGTHAARIVDAWFIDPATRMTPHLDYAQVRLGHNGDRNTGPGIIEFRNIAFLFDAVRLLVRDGHLSAAQHEALQAWFTDYAGWLESSEAGMSERRSANNHGTFYDVQLAALGLFLGSPRLVATVRNRAALRLVSQLQPDGSQPHELKREIPRHYYAFNLAGWSILARLLAPTDCDLWAWRDGEGRSLRGAVEKLAALEAEGWAGSNEPFDPARLVPLLRDHAGNFPAGALPAIAAAAPAGRFDPDAGLAPYWMLGRKLR